MKTQTPFIDFEALRVANPNRNRVILHSDANCFYASVECLYDPDIRDKPVAVCGDPEARHGIVLTKNYIAKKYGIQTGEVIFKAKQKCPDLIVVPAHYDLYRRFSRKLRRLYESYTDRVEAYGLDENWLDISGGTDIADGARLADEIRERVKDELGISVSVGVADNKAFAKLGSDMKKPDGTTVIRAMCIINNHKAAQDFCLPQGAGAQTWQRHVKRRATRRQAKRQAVHGWLLCTLL